MCAQLLQCVGHLCAPRRLNPTFLPYVAHTHTHTRLAPTSDDKEEEVCLAVAVRHPNGGQPTLRSMVLGGSGPPPLAESKEGKLLLGLFRVLGSVVARQDARVTAPDHHMGHGVLDRVQAGPTLTHLLLYAMCTGNGPAKLLAAGPTDREAKIAAAAGEMVLNAWHRQRRGILKVVVGILLAGSGASKTLRTMLEGLGIALKAGNLWHNYDDAEVVGIDDGMTDTRRGNAVRELSAPLVCVLKHDNLGFKRGAAAGRNGWAAWLQIVELNFDEVTFAEVFVAYTRFLRARAQPPAGEGVDHTEQQQQRRQRRRRLRDCHQTAKDVIPWEDHHKVDGQALLDRMDAIVEWYQTGVDVKTIKAEKVLLPNLVSIERLDPNASSGAPVAVSAGSSSANDADVMEDICRSELDAILEAREQDGRTFVPARSLHVPPIKEDLNAVSTNMMICKYRLRVHFGLLMRLAKGQFTAAEEEMVAAFGDRYDKEAYLAFLDEVGAWTSGDGAPAYVMVTLATEARCLDWRVEVATDINTDHPDLEDLLGYCVDEHKVGDLVGDLIDGKLHWIVELFGLRGQMFSGSHLEEVTKVYRQTPGRLQWILEPSLPRQSRMESQEASAAQTILLHEALAGILRDLGAATDEDITAVLGADLSELVAAAEVSGVTWVDATDEDLLAAAAAAAGQQGGAVAGPDHVTAEERIEEWRDNHRALQLRYTIDAFIEFLASFSGRADAKPDPTRSPVDNIRAGLRSFTASYICAEDLNEYFVWRAFSEPGVVPLFHEHRHMNAGFNVVDDERRSDGTAAEAMKFRASQAVVAQVCALRHAFKYCRLFCHTTMLAATSSSELQLFVDECFFTRPYGRNLTRIWLDRGQEWNMALIRFYEGHKDGGGDKFRSVGRTVANLNNFTQARYSDGGGQATEEGDMIADRQRGCPFTTSAAFPAHYEYYARVNAFGPGPTRSHATGEPRAVGSSSSLSGVRLEDDILGYPLCAQEAIDGYLDELYYDGPAVKVGVRFRKRHYTDADRTAAEDKIKVMFRSVDWRLLGLSGTSSNAVCKDAKFLAAELKWRAAEQADDPARLEKVYEAAVADAERVNDGVLKPKELVAAKVCGARREYETYFPDADCKWSVSDGARAIATTARTVPDLRRAPFYKTYRRGHSRPYKAPAAPVIDTDRDDVETAVRNTDGW